MNSNQFLSITMSTLLLLTQTLQASGIKVDFTASKSYQSSLDKAPNGVPIINIVKPNSSGLSHNKFKEFNVEKKGLILNNSNKVVKTKLAGYISYNPNLKGVNAKLILNEVTSNSKTLLQGFSEVAGKKADVIVANPNGISVNGGGFINTNRVTLTTAKPLIFQEVLKGFDVNKGVISIDKEGFNTNNIDRVSLYAKAVNINAKFYANKVDIITGSNKVNYDGSYISYGKQGSKISIDSSLLGGVYANAITLESSDKGVGINLPPEVYAQDSLNINANGDISLNEIVGKNIEIASSGDILSSSNIYTNSINLFAQKDINIKNTSTINAFADYHISGSSINNQGEISALQGVSKSSINAKESINNGGLIAGYDMLINAKEISNYGAFYSKNNLFITAKNLNNNMMIRSNKDINLLIEDNLYNAKEGMIYSDGKTNIQANPNKQKINTVTNKGVIQASNNINITAKTLNNIADTPIAQESSSSSTKIIPKGSSNNYDVVTTDIKTQEVPILSTPALILSDKNINIDVQTLNNFYSLIGANGNIILSANSANNLGKIILKVKTTVVKQYRDERYCSSNGPSGICFNHKHRAAYRGTFTTTQSTKLPIVSYGIQAQGSINGDVVTLNNLTQQLDSLKDSQIIKKIQQIKSIKTDSISLQKEDTFLKSRSTNEIKLLNSTKSTIDSIAKKSDLSSFKTNLNSLKNTLDEYMQQDKISINSLKFIIKNQKTILNSSNTDRLNAKLDKLQTLLQTTQQDINTLSTISNALNTLNDFTSNKDTLKSISQSIKDNFTAKSQILKDITKNSYIPVLISSLESVSNTLRDEVDKALDLKKDIKYKTLSTDNGLYQINTNHTLSTSPTVNINIKKTININNLTLPQGKYNLFIKDPNSNAPYLIKANSLYANYSSFISSDYMLKKLSLNPNKIIKRLGDGMYETEFVRDSIMELSGSRYIKGFNSDKAQFKALMDNAVKEQKDIHLTFGVSLTKEQINRLKSDIVWLEKRVVDGQSVLVPQVYLSSNNISLYGPRIEAKNITLHAKEDIFNSANIVANNSIFIDTKSLTSKDANIIAKKDLSIYAKENINNLSSLMQSGRNLTLNAQNINTLTLMKTDTYSYKKGIEHTTSLSNKSQIKSNGNINIDAKGIIGIYASNIDAKGTLTLNAKKDININAQHTKHNYNFTLNGGYNKGDESKQIASNLQANDISISSTNLNIKASTINANNNLSIDTKRTLTITSAQNQKHHDFKHEVKGGLFGGGEKTQDTINNIVQIKSLLKAKNIKINAKEINQIASDIKALQTKIYTKVLNLTSKKNSFYKNHYSDNSGFLTRTIKSKGYIKDKAVASTIQSQKLIFNNKDITFKLKPIQRQIKVKLTQELQTNNIIKTLSSEYNLNQSQINQVKAILKNKHWDESHTSLSTVGAIIVAIAVTALTAGMGTGAYVASSLATTGTTATITAATTNAVVAGIGAQIATSAITGESFKLDVKSLIQSAVTAGVLSGVNSAFTADALNKNMNIATYVKNATIRGTTQGAISELSGGEFKDGFETGVALSVLNDSSLQMRQYVKKNFDYSGKEGSPIPEDIQSAGLNGDGAKIAGSHFKKIKVNGVIGHKDIIAPFGGSQTGERKLFGRDYPKGGLIDNVLEHFAGPHDFLSSWNYKNISGNTYLKSDGILENIASGILLLPAAPLAISTAIQNNIGIINAININMKKDKQKVKSFTDLYYNKKGFINEN